MTMRPRDEARAAGPDALLKAGFELALVLVDAAESSGTMTLSWFERAVSRCVQAGIPVEAVHAAVNESVKNALAQADPAGETAGCNSETGRDPGMLDGFVELLTSAVSRAYSQ
ncbi:hypothetical protein ACFQZZ_25475 [Nocardia sp. GCM10030253]|uniref:hypothetical protein n=1 Tax=Nocardia sp. GCM10030253 TaxID=3273404 RepID=UPI00363922BD